MHSNLRKFRVSTVESGENSSLLPGGLVPLARFLDLWSRKRFLVSGALFSTTFCASSRAIALAGECPITGINEGRNDSGLCNVPLPCLLDEREQVAGVELLRGR